jgi:hypothetical protein
LEHQQFELSQTLADHRNQDTYMVVHYTVNTKFSDAELHEIIDKSSVQAKLGVEH